MIYDDDLLELIDRHLRGELDDAGREQLAQHLDSNVEARRLLVDHAQWDARFAEVLRDGPGGKVASCDEITVDSVRGLSSRELTHKKDAQRILSTSQGSLYEVPIARVLVAIAAVVIVLLGASLYSQQAHDRPIARITGLSGSLLWTGDGGLVEQDLRVDTVLTGGTVEGMTPNSWVEFEFNDGSVVTISGNSMLTFSDDSQKELYLRGGKVSANVVPQPAGHPMLIHTRTATVEVLGTQLNLEAELTSTTLNVTEGKVRMTRLTDGSTVEVPARYRVVASDEQELTTQRVPDSIHHWRSELQLGPQGTMGNWIGGSDQEPPRLRAIPFVVQTGKRDSFTIYSVGFGVSRGDQPPVIFQSDSRLRVRGRIDESHQTFFGVTVNHPSGEFAGKYQVIDSMLELDDENRFDVVLRLSDFRLDPSLNRLKDTLPADPVGSVVEAFWCHTLNQPAGLEIVAVELVSGVDE